MSININYLYCKHLLVDDNIKKYILNKSKFANYYDCPHHIFHIKDTIQYDAIETNNFEMYTQLITTTNQMEHSVEIFKNLINNFNLTKMDKIKLVYDNKINKYILIDGIHRLAILMKFVFENGNIPIQYLDIEFGNNIINEIKTKLANTTNKNHYNNWHNRTSYGYHSFNLFNINILGQRNPVQRINIMKEHIDFTNKTIVDFGCNTGGMLIHIPEIKAGYGIDYDKNCIDVARFITNKINFNNSLIFENDDLNNFDMHEFLNKYTITNIDICLLLSIGSWIKNWPKLYSDVIKNSKIIILETNNDIEGKPQLELFKNFGCSIKLISENSFDDSTNNFGRKTYIVTTNI